MKPDEAQEALKIVRGANESLARSLDCPPWRHAAFGGVSATLIAALALPRAYYAPLFVCAMAATVWIVRWDRRRYGTFVNGWRMGRTLPLSVGLMACMIGLIVLASRGRSEAFLSPLGALAIGLAFAVGTAASVVWQRIYLAELRTGVRP